MTISNTITRETFAGDGINDDFPVNFVVFEETVIKVFHIDNAEVETELTEGPDFTFDTTPVPTQVTVDAAWIPAADEFIRLERRSPNTQENDLIENQFSNETIEESLDRLTMQTQELADDVSELEAAGGSPAPSSAGLFPDWATATDYVQYQVVINGGRQYRVVTDHTSNTFSTDLLDGKLEELTYRGIKGEKGDKGDDGADGADGADSVVAGPAGPAGADGVFSDIATTGEAQLGTDNTKGMTPLRVAEAIAYQVDTAQITQNQADVATLNVDLMTLASRVSILEVAIENAKGTFAGQQQLINNSGPTDLEGADAGIPVDKNKGFALSRQSSGTLFAKVTMFVSRVTDTEHRFSSFDLIMQFVNGVWLIGRDGTDQLDDTLNFDGVTLSVTNTDVGGGVILGQVQYTTDLMNGANHDDNSIIAWRGQELSK